MEKARIGGQQHHPTITRRMEWSGIGGKNITPSSRDAADGQILGYIRHGVGEVGVIRRSE